MSEEMQKYRDQLRRSDVKEAMRMGRKPTDDEIVAAVKYQGNGVTFMIRNTLIMNRTLDPRIETPYVLRRLKKLEKAGRVRRRPSCYVVQICWEVV